MGSARRPRGRLPQRVYWIRRSVVLGVALLLVFGIAHLLGGNGKDPASSNIQASTSSAQEQETTPSVSQGPVAASATPPRSKGKAPLLPPSGECRDDEVSVLPSVKRAWGAEQTVIRLGLQGLQPACTFRVSPETLVVKITSGEDRIWSSQDCPDSIKDADVVVRSGVPTYVNVVWSGRRSDDTCSNQADWARQGFYHVYAAALGSTPTDVQFEVTHAPTHVVTKTAKPKPTATTSPSSKASPNGKPTSSPTVKGKQSKCGGDNAASSC
jgi:hypothetical protein